MVLHARRGWMDWWLVPVAGALVRRGVPPDVVTWLSFPFSLAAALFILLTSPAEAAADHFLLLAFVALSLASLLDLIDGKMARLAGNPTPRGDYLDHVIDRFADAALLVAIAISPFSNTTVGILAVAGVLLTSYMGTQAHAVGIGRNYRGLLGRADRQVMLLGALLLDQAAAYAAWSLPTQWAPGWIPALLVPTGFLGILMLWFAAAGNLTALQRFAQGLAWFSKRSPDPGQGDGRRSRKRP